MGKVKRNKKSRNLILKLAVLVFAGWVVFELVSIQLELSGKMRVKEELDLAVQQQQQENEKLQDVLDNGETSDFIEQLAREKYGFIYQDEHVYANKNGN